MKHETIGGVAGVILSGVGAGLSLEQLQQIISIICTCIGAIIVLITSVIIPLVKWYKKSKEDGKITKEELEEGKEIISNGVKTIKDSLDKKN